MVMLVRGMDGYAGEVWMVMLVIVMHGHVDEMYAW